MSFEEFLHGLFVAKDIQQSDVEPEWEQHHSTPYNHAPPPTSPNYTSKVRALINALLVMGELLNESTTNVFGYSFTGIYLFIYLYMLSGLYTDIITNARYSLFANNRANQGTQSKVYIY